MSGDRAGAPTDFLALHERLRAEGYDPARAYWSRHDGGGWRGHCQGAWNVAEVDGGLYVTSVDLDPRRGGPARAGAEAVPVADEAEACAVLWRLVTHGQTAGTYGVVEPPPEVTGFVRRCGCEPTETLFGAPYAAMTSTDGHWVAQVGDRYELRTRSITPPTAARTAVVVDDPDDAFRLLMLLVGRYLELRLPLTTPVRGLPGALSPEEQLARVGDAGLARLAAAFEPDSDDPVLDVVRPGLDDDLLPGSLAARLAARGIPVARAGRAGRPAVEIGGDGYEMSRCRITRTGTTYVVETAPERSNAWRTVLESADPVEAHRTVAEHYRLPD